MRADVAVRAPGKVLTIDESCQQTKPASVISNLKSTTKVGEPHDLLGKRLVFTNWHYVRPGTFRWRDAKGNALGLSTNVDPNAASFHQMDVPRGIRLVAQPAKRSAPLGVYFNTVIRDGNLFRAWGGGQYVESDDGLSWRKPELGLVEVNGSKKNNHVNLSPGTVFKDPSAPPSERYKGVHEGDATREQFELYKRQRPDDWHWLALAADPGRVHCVLGAVSPDGLRWEALPAPITVEHSDTLIIAHYDPRLKKYVMYTRNYPAGPRSEKVPYKEFRVWEGTRRSIGRTASDDFRSFPVSEVILEPTPDMAPSDMLYANCRTSIPGAPDHHLMFPAIWHSAMDDTTSFALASSHDGKLWHWVSGPRVLETASYGDWDGGCMFAVADLLELPNGDFALPYVGYNVPHKYPRGQQKSATAYALWPKGRLVALEAPEVGEFATVAIVPPGRKLKINAVAGLGGNILVEAAGWDYAPLPGRTFADAIPLAGDLFWKTVTWKTGDDFGHADDASVILRFKMRKAKIFGLEFE